jgi:hypothetical protein
MPTSPVVAIPPEEQVPMLAALRRARYGSLRALHILLWCAACHAGGRGLRRDQATLAPRERLGVDARPTGRQR